MPLDWVFDDDGEFISGSVILKIDSGPGRIGMGAGNAAMRKKAAARGLFLFPGLQNATAVSQEIDELHTGTERAACDAPAVPPVAAAAAAPATALFPAAPRPPPQAPDLCLPPCPICPLLCVVGTWV